MKEYKNLEVRLELGDSLKQFNVPPITPPIDLTVSEDVYKANRGIGFIPWLQIVSILQYIKKNTEMNNFQKQEEINNLFSSKKIAVLAAHGDGNFSNPSEGSCWFYLENKAIVEPVGKWIEKQSKKKEYGVIIPYVCNPLGVPPLYLKGKETVIFPTSITDHKCENFVIYHPKKKIN